MLDYLITISKTLWNQSISQVQSFVILKGFQHWDAINQRFIYFAFFESRIQQNAAKSLTIQSPQLSVRNCFYGGCSGRVIEKSQFPKTSTIVIGAHRFFIFTQKNIVDSTKKFLKLRKLFRRDSYSHLRFDHIEVVGIWISLSDDDILSSYFNLEHGVCNFGHLGGNQRLTVKIIEIRWKYYLFLIQ